MFGYSFRENEGKRPEEVHFNLEGKHLNYLFYPLQIVRNCDGWRKKTRRKDGTQLHSTPHCRAWVVVAQWCSGQYYDGILVQRLIFSGMAFICFIARYFDEQVYKVFVDSVCVSLL